MLAEMIVAGSMLLGGEPIVASDDCYAMYSADWCTQHAVALAQTKPVFEDLAEDNVGGFTIGDTVPINGPREGAVIGPEDQPYLQALERFVQESDRHWVVLMTAGESEFNEEADNPYSTAGGYVQALEMWERVMQCNRYEAECAARIAAHLLANGGRSHWQYQP